MQTLVVEPLSPVSCTLGFVLANCTDKVSRTWAPGGCLAQRASGKARIAGSSRGFISWGPTLPVFGAF